MDAKTKTESSTLDEVVSGTRAPLVKVVPVDQTRVDLFNPARWTKEDIDTIKKTVCPSGIPDADFKLFIMKCQASGMNPLLGEAFCVKRRQNIGNRDNPQWIDVFAFTPGEQGMEGRADDFPDYRGLRAAAYYEKDKIVLDPSSGDVSHQYNPATDRGRLIGAWGIAFREGRKTPLEDVKLVEYSDARNPKWASSPATMIVKCARAAALRRAYPNAFDGIYAREELRDDGDDAATPTEAQAEQAGRDTTSKLADRMKSTAAVQAGLGGTHIAPSSAPASGATVDVIATKPTEKVAAPTTSRPANTDLPAAGGAAIKAAGGITTSEMDRADKAGPAPTFPEGPLMAYGPKKGSPIATLEGPELLEYSALGKSKVGSLEGAKAAKVNACIAAIEAEQKKREKALTDELDVDFDPPEPGSAG